MSVNLAGMSLALSIGSSQAASASPQVTQAPSPLPFGAHDVIVGAHIDNVQTIDFTYSRFTADKFLWMR
jgi:hypothetical protein